jgi:Zn-dependent peptidase ImmA (M78 family)
MGALNLSTEVLRWAAAKAGESLEALCLDIARRPKDRERIVQGEITVGQARKVAKKAGIPFGYLFLPEPPKVSAPRQIADLRQVPDASPLSKDYFDVLADAIKKQDWYRELLTQESATAIAEVGSFDPSKNPDAAKIAADIREHLKLTDEDRRGCRDADGYFSLIAERAEGLGILVLKSGVVPAHTKRPLSEKEFRGFALSDSLAPLVFVNGRDADVASVFTLLHELAHIWLGVTGVSDIARHADGLERLCNRVAADALMPKQAFLEQWKRSPDVSTIARHFRVSRWAAAIAALELHLIGQSDYAAIAAMSARARPKGKGGLPWNTIPVQNSKRLTRTIVNRALSGRMMLREAAGLLNIKPGTVVSLAREMSGG